VSHLLKASSPPAVVLGRGDIRSFKEVSTMSSGRITIQKLVSY